AGENLARRARSQRGNGGRSQKQGLRPAGRFSLKLRAGMAILPLPACRRSAPEWSFVMANWNDPQSTRTSFGASTGSAGAVGTQQGVVFDAGLRKHMLSIYNYMTSGVLLTGIVAMLFSRG